MDSACSYLSEEHLLCSICLSIFTNPVSIPCGHNYCKSCISLHWQSKNVRHCPICREAIPKKYNLRVNNGLSDLVEHFKKIQGLTRNGSAAKPGDVPCDFCDGTKVKAVKSCLACLASYCEFHLEPHRRATGLRRHKLTNPLPNLEERMCKKHDRVLELFCKTDQTCVCVLCAEHHSHDRIPIENAYEERKSELVETMVGLRDMVQERQLKVQELQASALSVLTEKEEALAKTVETFSVLMAPIQAHMCNLLQAIAAKQGAAQGQAEGLILELEAEITKLQKRSNQLNVLFRNTDHLKFLQNLPSLPPSDTPRTKNWSHANICSQLRLCEDVTAALVQVRQELTKMIDSRLAEHTLEVCGCESTNQEPGTAKELREEEINLDSLPEVTKMKVIRQRYTVDVTLDINSSGDFLVCTCDGKQVLPGFSLWAQNKQQFEHYSHIFGRRGFSAGRFYFEVQVKDKSHWDVGVARWPAGGAKKLTLNVRNGAWILRRVGGNKYQALGEGTVNIALQKQPNMVGVFVDYEGGLVSFYDADAAALIHSVTGCNFRDKIFPVLSPGPATGGRNCLPMVIAPVTPRTNPLWETLWFFFVLLALIWIWFWPSQCACEGTAGV